jgi:hypothetical protein
MLMQDTGFRNPYINKFPEPCPIIKPESLAAPFERLKPKAYHLAAKLHDTVSIAGDGIVVKLSIYVTVK